MIKKIAGSFLLALQNIRSHFFHTLLSVLGIVIGVASLVGILSLIDGMEEFARDQINTTTSLKAITLRTEQYRRVNNIRLKKDTFAIVDHVHFLSLKPALTLPARAMLRSDISTEVEVSGSDHPVGTIVMGVSVTDPDPSIQVLHGKLFAMEDVMNREPLAVVNVAFADLIDKEHPQTLPGRQITYEGRTVTVVGVVGNAPKASPYVIVPITLFDSATLRDNPPEVVIEADLVEDVPSLKKEVDAWIAANYPGSKDDFVVSTNEFRVEQAAKGFKLFRVVMGLIVGISVLVGGIGVMNVLLISITERTVEIGIRKAMGANKRDIVLQFLSESITVSAFGSLLGLVLGILGTMAFVPIIRAITEIPFQASYTWNTLIVISVVSLVVGIVFGTYPAIRASRLDPVEAIRRE